MIEIPLRSRTGETIAVALVDDEDAAQAQHRWSRSTAGYVVRTGNRLLHRELLGLVAGDRRQVDHRNRDRLDNRRANLRIATAGENAQNRRPDNVWRDGDRWRGAVDVDGRRIYIPRVATEAEARDRVRVIRATLMPYSIEAATLLAHTRLPAER